ncbi:MAG: S8 family peptidase [Lachnospiraceae bacterium]|nr:S8 family peptidase [Lachnospiraceae bacterium]
MPDSNCLEAILSNDYYDFLIAPEYFQQYAYEAGYCTQPIGRIAGAVYIPREVYPIISMQNTLYSSIPKLYGIAEGTISDQIRSIPQQQEDIMGLTGQGILIGFIGTGIHYESDYFRTSDGRTRILGIWDQTIQEGTPPANIQYGTEYTEEMINQALQSDDPSSIVPSTDTHGHGTYMASAAAASESPSGDFRGVAPAASIGVVKLKEAKPYLKEYYAIKRDAIAYQENDIMLAIRYLFELANNQKMPLVLCFGIGTNIGNHNTGSFLSNYIDEISVGNHCAVFGTGNEADRRHHFSGNFNLDPEQEYIDVEVRVENNPTGFWMELWGTAPDIYTLEVLSPTGETMQRVPYRIGTGADYNFVFEKSTLSFAYQVIGNNIGNPAIIMRLTNPSNGIWTFRIYGTNLTYGQFHVWLPLSEFIEGSTYFLASNPEMTLTEPSTSIRSIAVSAYDSGNNSILLESGRGFTFTGLIKPYFAAPGVAVPGIDLDNTLIRRTGTSGSSALTAGACALLFEWGLVQGNDMTMGVIRLSTILIRGADRNYNRVYPNREWGYGTLNLSNTFNNLRPI